PRVRAQMEADSIPGEGVDLRPEPIRMAGVGAGDLGPEGTQQPASCHAAPGQADHGDAATGQDGPGRMAPAGVAEGPSEASIHRGRGCRRPRHRSLSVVSAMSAMRKARIQNLITTFDSGHPISSKWW